MRILNAVSVLLVPMLYGSSGWAQAGQTDPFRPYKLNAGFMEVQVDNDNMHLEDFKIEAAHEGFLGKEPAKCSFSVKNRMVKKLQLSVGLALFDAKKGLVAAGGYNTVPVMGGFGPREAGNETFTLGFVEAVDLQKVEYYQLQVRHFLEEPTK